MLRALRVARRSALRARTQAANQLHALVVTAPDSLRAQLRHLRLAQLVETAASFRPGVQPTTPLGATKLALKSIALRYQQLTREIAALDTHLSRLVAAAAPALATVKGLGPETGSALLVAAGDNPERLRGEAAFARLCGVAPVPASSGRTTRYRLSRGGNRDANRALYLLAIGRMGWDARTRDYVARRTKDGLSKTEIIRCLKRYIAREVYRLLISSTQTDLAVPLDKP
jgi:transposase